MIAVVNYVIAAHPSLLNFVIADIQFPNIIRLDNREGRTRNRRYIIPDNPEDAGATLTGIRAAHTDHPWDTSNPEQQAG